MTSRTNLLQSGLRLLIHDQQRITSAFEDWTEADASADVAAPVITSVYERLKGDLDRLCILAESYDITPPAEETNPAPTAATGESPEVTTLPRPSSTPTPAAILQKGYEALEVLSMRYASVYCMATAVMEPPVANVAHTNLKGTRDLASELVGALAIVTVEDVTTAHPELVMNVTAGAHAQDLLQNLWAPNASAHEAAAEGSYVVGERSPAEA